MLRGSPPAAATEISARMRRSRAARWRSSCRRSSGCTGRTDVSRPAGRNEDAGREQIREHEPAALDDLAAAHGDRRGEHRAVRDARVELAVLAARVDAGREIVEERGVEGAAGE